MESSLHEHVKRQALYWLKEKMTDLCANEVKLFVRRKKLKADALGINIKRKESRIIEVKISRSDYLRDEVLFSSNGYHAICDYAYIITPVGLLSIEELPKGYGLLEIDDFDTITVRKKPVRNPNPLLTLDTLIKRTGRAATNAVLFQQLSKETKDPTNGSFSKKAKVHLISATCQCCKRRNKYLIQLNQENVQCISKTCKQYIDLNRARTHFITSYNEDFLKQLQALMD